MTRRIRRSETPPTPCSPAWLWLLAGIFIGIFLSFLFYLKQLAPHASNNTATSTMTPNSSPSSTTANSATESNAETAPQASNDTELQLPPAEQTKPTAPTPRFEFYDMLPKSQITPADRPPAEAELAQIEREDNPTLNAPPITALPTAAPPMRPEDFPVAGQPYQPPVTAPPVGQPYQPPNIAAPPASVQPVIGSFMLQIASFRDERSASDLQFELKQRGFSSRVEQALVQGQQWYRIKLGPYANQTEAQQAQNQLQQHGYKPIVQKIQ